MGEKRFSDARLTCFNALALISMFFISGCASFDSKEQVGHFKGASFNANKEAHKVTSTILNSKPLVLSIDGGHGARIASLTWHGQQVLSGKEVHQENWGSTFWSSPQSQWGWPPPEAFDVEAYDLKVMDHKVVATGKIDPKTGYQFTKIVAIKKRGPLPFLELTYSIKNHSKRPQSVAPWEISRVAPSGLTFYPGAKGSFTSPYPVKVKQGMVWLDYASSSLQADHQKLMGDGNEGWLAHIDRGLLFLKVFTDIDSSSIAPKEGEVEIYRNPDGSYVELEVQGAYRQLQPEESYEWKVYWIFAQLPPELDIKESNEKLVHFVRETKRSFLE